MNAPPRLLRRILRATLPYEDRDTLVHELDELYATRAARVGLLRARLWYARQTLAFVVRVLLMPYLTRRGDVRRAAADIVREDVSYGWRQLRRAPVFTIVATLSLAVGIGVTVSALAFVNAMFKPLPLPEADRLMRVYTSDFDGHHKGYGGSSYPDFEDYAASGVFEQLVGLRSQRVALATNDLRPVMERLTFVSPNFFTALRVRPQHGRTFRPAGDEPEVVLSYRLWEQTFNLDPNIIGGTVLLNGAEFVVVGVMPETFNGVERGGAESAWVPATQLARADAGQTLDERGDRSFQLIGRLHAGLNRKAADTRLRALAASLAARHPEAWVDAAHQPRRISLLTERESLITPDERLVVFAVFAGIGLLLLLVLMLACTNVAGMLLARALERSHEVAVRLTLGATRLRIAAQMVTESLLLALLGGVAGLAAMTWSVSLLQRTREMAGFDMRPDWRVFLAAIAVCCLCALLFGLAPLLQTLNADMRVAMTSTHTAGRGRTRMRGMVIAVQVAASTLLLLIAVAAQRGVRAQLGTDPGFDVSGLIAVRIPYNLFGTDTVRGARYAVELHQQLASLPGVQHAARSSFVPFGNAGGATRVEIDNTVAFVGSNEVSHEFFAALGVPLLSGRSFRAEDIGGAPDVAVVSKQFAVQYGPDVIGKTVQVAAQRRVQIVGVVGDIVSRDISTPIQPMIYRPLAQAVHLDSRSATQYRNTPGAYLVLQAGWQGRDILLRMPARLEAATLIAVQRMLRERFPDVVMPRVQTVADMIAENALPQRIGSRIALGAAMVELGLAAAGLYGLLLFALLARTRELGLRLALGAAPRQASWAVLRDGLRYAFIGAGGGLLLGIPAVLASSRSLLGTRAGDPVPFIAAACAIVIAAAAAAIVPAWRAARTQPGHALRHN